MRLADRGFAGLEAVFTLSHGAERLWLGNDPEQVRLDLQLEGGQIENTRLWRVGYRVTVFGVPENAEGEERELYMVHAAFAAAVKPEVEVVAESDLVLATWPHARADLLNLAPPVSARPPSLPLELELPKDPVGTID